MMAYKLSGLVKWSALVFGLMSLSACDPKRSDKDKAPSFESGRRVCYFVIGGAYGKAGMRGREFIGGGPKQRLVQWKTPYFPEDGQVPDSRVRSQAEIELNWRASIGEKTFDASLDSMRLALLGFSEEKASLIKKLRFDTSFGDSFTYDFKPDNGSNKGRLVVLFSTEDRGVNIPSQLSEVLGGVNGNRFKLELLDGAGSVLHTYTFYPPNGSIFRTKVKQALSGLDKAIKSPENCALVSGN